MLSAIGYYVTAIVCIITAFVIQRIYFKEKRRKTSNLSLNGIKWFGLAILSWGIGSLVNIVLISVYGIAANNTFIVSLEVFFSLLNSLFILMSLPSIEHSGKRNIVIKIIERFTEKEVFVIFGGVLIMISFVFIASFFNTNQSNSGNNFIWLIDIPISLIVAFALLHELNKAFRNRGMKFMFLPTYALFILIVIAVTHRLIPEAQVLKLMDLPSWNFIGVIAALSFKFTFILLFTILLYSWKLLAENEEQQTELKELLSTHDVLVAQREKLLLANESHLDTIKHLKVELTQRKKKYKKLEKTSKVELSDRQKEVLANIAVFGEQKSYSEIAEAMHIGVDGLQAHIYQIKKVLNISGSGGKKQLITYATEKKLLQYATIS